MSRLLQGGTMRRRRNGPVVAAIAMVVAAGIAVALIAGGNGGSGGKPPLADVRPAVGRRIPPAHPGQAVPLAPPGIVLTGRQLRVHLHPKPGAALMFDLGTGRVLWSLRPMTIRPIASVTKIMTAL